MITTILIAILLAGITVWMIDLLNEEDRIQKKDNK